MSPYPYTVTCNPGTSTKGKSCSFRAYVNMPASQPTTLHDHLPLRWGRERNSGICKGVRSEIPGPPFFFSLSLPIFVGSRQPQLLPGNVRPEKGNAAGSSLAQHYLVGMCEGGKGLSQDQCKEMSSVWRNGFTLQ